MSLNMAWAALKSAVGAAPAVAAAATQASAAVRTLATVKPHVPMIKFRAGAPVAATAQPEPVAAQAAPSSGPLVYEWYDTPAKYRKGLMDEAELDCINMGGADVKWQ